MDRPSLIFWKQWLKEYRLVWFGAAGIFVFSLLFLWFSYIRGTDSVIHWERLQEQRVVETTVHSFRLGPFELNVPAESYVILEYLDGSDIIPNTAASYTFLAALALSVVLMLSVITTLPRFWYFAGMGLFILFMVSLRLEVLGLFGSYGKVIPAAVMGIYVVVSYYFNRVNSTYPFVLRLLIFLALTVVLAAIIAVFSQVEYPFYHLTLTGYVPGLIMAVLFIILVAHEILASFVYIAGQGSTKSLRHLSIISVVYMVNVIITCLHEMGIVQWNFLYINLYLLLSVSAVLGLWGFRHREGLYGSIISFNPFGAYFFVALGAICFATTAQLLGNANDPGLRVIRDFIIFSHVGFGMIFLTYIFSNFVLMLARNMPVYKVLYAPTRMPYFTFRFAGTIFMLGFVFYSNWHEYVFHSTAAFYNTAGDMHTLFGNRASAEALYLQGSGQAFRNHRSNYALGRLRSQRQAFEDAHYSYALANGVRPSEYSLANAGNLYIWESNSFGAIGEYRRSLEKMPTSAALLNNLGYAYIKGHNRDSALYFLDQARKQSLAKGSAEINFFALAAAEDVPLKTDSVLALFASTHPAVLSNALALSTLHEEEFTTPVQPLANKRLNLHTATLLNNYVVKYATTLDTAFVNEAYRIASDSLNSDYSEALRASLAFAFYHQGNVTKALSVLAELSYISQDYSGKFNYIMGLWALEQHNPELASSYFTFADTYDYKKAKFYNAIALTEAHRFAEAYAAWDTVRASADQGEQVVARQMQHILTLPAAEALALNDPIKYQFCRYRIGLADSVLFNRFYNSIENANYKAQALLDLSRRYVEVDAVPAAIRLFNRIGGLELTDKKLYDDIRYFELQMLAHRGEVRALANQINKGVTFDQAHMLEKMLYTGLLSSMSGDTATARKNFEPLSTYNPYFEEGIIAAANFFRNLDAKSMKPYDILAEAIQINANSERLMRAYADEAARKGFDEYSANARQMLQDLQQRTH